MRNISRAREELWVIEVNIWKRLLFDSGDGLSVEGYTDANYAGSLVNRRSTNLL